MSPRSFTVIALALLGGGGGIAASAAVGGGGPPAHAAAHAAVPVTKLPGGLLEGLAQAPDGGYLAATVDISTSQRRSATLVKVGEVGGRATTVPLVRRPTGTARVSNVIAAVSQAGAVAAAARRSHGPESRSTLRVTTVGPDGRRVSETRAPGLGRGASPWVLEIGPTGAVGLISLVPTKQGAVARFSFRPAGAERFAPAVAMPTVSIPSEDGSESSDAAASRAQIVMAPDGGAAVVDGLTSVVRRVTPTGVVGAEQRLDPKGASATVAAFRPDGTLIAASSRPIESPTKTIDDQYYSSQLTIGVWSAGAPAPELRELPLRPGQVEANENLSLALGAGDRTILTLADGDDHLAVLAGAGTAVEPLGRVPAPRAYDARAFPRADGGVTLLWARDVDGVTGKPVADTALLSATAAPGGAFAQPRALRTSRTGSMQVEAALALPDDRLAIAFAAATSDASLLVARP